MLHYLNSKDHLDEHGTGQLQDLWKEREGERHTLGQKGGSTVAVSPGDPQAEVMPRLDTEADC